MKEIINKQNLTTFLTHLLCISILFILPEVLTSLSNLSRPVRPWVYTKAFVYIGVFYLNYYWIIEKSLDKPKRIVRFLASNIIVIIVSLIILYLIWRFKGYLGGKDPMRNYISPTEGLYIVRWVGMMSRDLVTLILVIGFATALRIGDKWMMLDRRQKDLISSQREEELKNLKSQLNPHFLFNTLNSIYALIAISPPKAQGAVHELSKLLRYVLYDSPSHVSLKQEIDFIDNYVNLMRLRLNPSIRLDIRLDINGNENLPIAPLLFISIIENVFKHGIHTPETPIIIDVTVSDGTISCFTSNGRSTINSPALKSGHGASGGIGMTNLRRRLDLLYGKSASLKTNITADRYEVLLTIKPHSTPKHKPITT